MGKRRRDVLNKVDPTNSHSVPEVLAVSSEAFATSMQNCLSADVKAGADSHNSDTIAVAVSGGADSMALCLLAANWATQNQRHLIALTVDHGLRPEARLEADQVGAWLKARGISHKVLCVEGEKPASNIQAWAREARYKLMENWCADAGINVLLLAHHMEDQAETVLLRLGRGSGVDGLAAMAKSTAPAFQSGPRKVRPLLEVPKQSLIATLVELKQEWIEDPTNQDQKYARNRLRNMAAELASINLTPSRLAATAKTMQRAKRALDADVLALMDKSLRIDEAGFGQLFVGVLSGAEAEVQLRMLGRLLAALGGQAYAPRLERLEPLLEAILAQDLGGGRTLSGCRVVPLKDTPDGVLICRESRSVEGALPIVDGQAVQWDRRYRVRAHGLAAGLVGKGQFSIGRLGPEGWAAVEKERHSGASSAIPRLAGLNLPALWQKEELLCVPALSYGLLASTSLIEVEFTALRRIYMTE